jgi:LysM repeat protein
LPETQKPVTQKGLRILILVLMALLASCRAARPPVSTTYSNGVAETYVDRFKDLAVSEMIRTGIPASITLAQGMVESNYGRSTLAREANNHFGIKCHNGWSGPSVRHHDDRRNECFRKYRSADESYYDHSEFLRTGSRYTFLFKLETTDYKGWARGLKQAGYATNPDYANMLIRKIEEHNLQRFDLGYATAGSLPKPKEPAKVPAKVPEQVNGSRDTPPVSNESANIPVSSSTFSVTARVNRVLENNRIQYVIVRDGETIGSLTEEFQLLKRELERNNDLSDNPIIVPGQIIYLQPKRDRAEAGREFHDVTPGETMHSISQKYGIKLKSLYELNRMAHGEEPAAGQRLWLRNKKPVS